MSALPAAEERFSSRTAEGARSGRERKRHTSPRTRRTDWRPRYGIEPAGEATVKWKAPPVVPRTPGDVVTVTVSPG